MFALSIRAAAAVSPRNYTLFADVNRSTSEIAAEHRYHLLKSGAEVE